MIFKRYMYVLFLLLPIWSMYLEGQAYILQLALKEQIPLIKKTQKYIAAVEKYIECMRYFSGDEKINGIPILEVAFKNRNINTIVKLLRCGADIKSAIASGVNIDSSDGYATPLDRAVRDGYLDVVKLLLVNGANVNSKDRFGHTPLFSAIANGSIIVIKMLLAHGADITIRDFEGKTALHVAAGLGSIDAAQLLLEAKSDINALDRNGNTPLSDAARFGRAEMVKLLISKGAKVNVKNIDGYTPLHWAAQYGHKDAVKTLLDFGANVNDATYLFYTLPGNGGWTPLHYAAWEGHLCIAKELILRGARIDACDGTGYTPSQVARLLNHREVAEYLENKKS